MKKQISSDQGMWRRRVTFIMAATGSTIGLGNIWKFPYITGENGGGAFILLYLACVTLVGLPILIAELVAGQYTRRNPVTAMQIITRESQTNRHWSLIGVFGCLAGLIILSYYAVVAGWGLRYCLDAVSGAFQGLSSELATERFLHLLDDSQTLIYWQNVFLLSVGMVVAMGVRRGVGVAMHILMPLMLLALGALISYSWHLGDFSAGLTFMLTMDFSALSWNAVLLALGHAFFTLSLGVGAMMAYGAYMPKRTSILGVAVTVALLDVLFALLAGLAIFAVVFANDIAPTEGPGLMFVSLPLAFGAMPYGDGFAAIFFGLVVFASFGSAVSLLEPSVAWLNERHSVPRWLAVPSILAVVMVVSAAVALSFNSEHPAASLAGMSLFQWLDVVTTLWLLPIGGFLLAIYVGWFMSPVKFASAPHFMLWRFVLRFVTAPAVLVIFAVALLQRCSTT